MTTSGEAHSRETLNRTVMALGCALIWGGQSVAVKVSLFEWPPLAVMAARFALAAAVLGVFAIGSGLPLRADGRQLRMIAGNVVLLVVQIGLFTVGTAQTTSARSVVIVNTFPFFAALACHFITHDSPLRRSQFIGLLLAFSGLSAVFAHRLSPGGASTSAGDLLVLSAAAVMGLKIAYVRRIVDHVPPVQLLFVSSAAAAALCVAASAAFETHEYRRLTPAGMASIGYQGCLASGLAALLWTLLLERNSPNSVTVFRLTSPPVGVFFGWLILSEEPSPGLLAGCVLIVAGILCVHHRSNSSTAEAIP